MEKKTIIRVFPTRSNMTPTDDLAFVGRPPFIRPQADEVHVSCLFTWDRTYANDLQKDWGQYYKRVLLGGPAYDDPGGEFIPGLYVKRGEVITSRGCRNNCSYCFVPKREGSLRLLEIKEGWDVLDNNLLACPREHIEAVLQMLRQQKRKVSFRGGLEARLFQDWFADAICEIGIKQAFFAYDRKGDVPHVQRAIAMLRDRGCSRQQIYCYVLVGFNKDSQDKATERLQWVKDQGASPFAMFYRDADSDGSISVEWRTFVRLWNRPAAIFSQHHQVMLQGKHLDAGPDTLELW